MGGQVIHDSAQWRNLWDEHASIYSRQPPLPSVDFSEEIVIAYFAGEKQHSGHRVEIDSVEVQSSADFKAHTMVVKVRAHGSARLSADVMTQPHHIVRVPKVGFTKATFEIL